MLEIRDLISHYGRIKALKGVSLSIAEGEIVSLIGGNGAGKTTLLRTVSGVQPASAGTIRFDGRDITRLSPRDRVACGITQVPEARQIFTALSIEDNLAMGAYLRRDGAIAADMERIYDQFPVLRDRRHQSAGGLSGGEQQMLAVGRALMARPRLLLLDEPSLGLAPILVKDIFRTISRLRDEGTTIFLVEQNAYAALSLADRGYLLETGTIVHSGSGKDLLADPKVREAYLGI